MIDSLLDSILDRTVVGGYTSVGYRIRSRAWQASDLERMVGKVVVVSGATSGIGLPWLLDLEQQRSDVAVYELPVLSSTYGPMRWFIDGGMTRGIPHAAARARTVTVYTDVRKVLDDLGLAGTDTIAVLIVDRSGRILAQEVGSFEQHKSQRLVAALGPKRSPAAHAS